MIGNQQLLEDNYALESVIGCGRAGIVFAARHGRLGLKFLRPDRPNAPEVVDRFVRDAQITARIQNRHVSGIRAFTPRTARAASSARDSESENGLERPAESVVR